MGNQPIQSEFSASQRLRTVIANDTYLQIVQRENAQECVDIDLSGSKKDNPFQHKYKIMLDSTIPPASYCMLIILFPSHPVEAKRVMYTSDYKTIGALGNELNDRLREARNYGDIPPVILACGKRLYRVKNVHCTLYLMWARRIQMCTINSHETVLASNIPILIEMDGHYSHRNIVMFQNDTNGGERELKPMDLECIDILIPFREPIYVCESVREKSSRTIETLSEAGALNYITSNPQAISSGDEIDFSSDDGGHLKIVEQNSSADT